MATRFTGKTLDISFARENDDHIGVRFTRIAKLHDRYTVRVSVYWDFYTEQSSAIAEVLTPALTWTELASEPAYKWHGTMSGAVGRKLPLAGPYERLSEVLVRRARAILA